MWNLLLGFPQITFAQNTEDNAVPIEPIPAAEIDNSIPVEKIDSRNDIPARTLFISLQTVEGAKTYEVQIRPRKRSWLEPHKVTTSREKMRLRVTPGDYEIRTRSIDEKRKPGRWLTWRPFMVPYKQPLLAYPAPDSTITPKGNLSEKIIFEWPAVPSSKGYRVKIYDENRKLLKHVITSQNWFQYELENSHSYFWSLNPLITIDEPDNPKFQKLWKFLIAEPDTELLPVNLKLVKNPRAVKYQFELVKMISEDESDEPTIYDSQEAEFRARLSPGEYELRARSNYDNNTVSAWSSPHRFWIPIPAPELLTPKNNSVIEPTTDFANPVTLTWRKSKWADRYHVQVHDDNGILFVNEFVKSPPYEIKLPHGNTYRWSVTPLLARQTSRFPAASENKNTTAQSEFKIDRYIHLSLGESEEPSQLYTWGRLIMSKANYQAENYDNNNKINEQIFSSTGEIALGYWHRKTSYGALATVGASNIDIAGHASSYTQFSLLGGARKYFEDQKRLRYWLGVSLKETPEVLVDGALGTLQIRNLKTLGPQALIAFLDAFNNKWGYQLYLGGFYGMKGINTPNDLPQKNYLSFFGSAYFTYRWKKSTTALVGYTYQNDQAGYASADRTGNNNRVQYEGHYLSFSLIVGLQDPQQ
ncbi:MAG: hypothetical protein ACXVCP_06070 [Bdellovibrio sp.]